MPFTPGERWLWGWEQHDFVGATDERDFEVATVECWKYDNEQDKSHPFVQKKFEICQFQATDDWLHKGHPLRKNKPPIAGLKMIVVPYTDQSTPMTELETISVNAMLGLPPYQYHMGSVDIGANGMFLQDDGSWVLVNVRTPDWAAIGTIFHYDPRTNVTRGIFQISKGRIDLSAFKGVIGQFAQCSHPLLMPLLAAELSLNVKIKNLRYSTWILKDIEAEMGYGLNVESRPKNPDYRGMIYKLGKGQSNLLGAMETLQVLEWTVRFVQQKIKHMDQHLDSRSRDRFTTLARVLDERAEYVLSLITRCTIHRNLKDRYIAQHSTLLNLVAQADSNLNITIAKDSRELAAASKQDSSSMKIVAFLTTFFLPGTFVATFFAMPLFDWAKPSIREATNTHFWIYWAVTVPLTITTMTGVVAWAIWNNHRVNISKLLARKSVDKETGKFSDTEKQ